MSKTYIAITRANKLLGGAILLACALVLLNGCTIVIGGSMESTVVVETASNSAE